VVLGTVASLRRPLARAAGSPRRRRAVFLLAAALALAAHSARGQEHGASGAPLAMGGMEALERGAGGKAAEAAALLPASVHRQLACRACHGEHSSPIDRDSQLLVCGSCHTAAAQQLQSQAHGRALASGAVTAPTCVGCHGSHGVTSRWDPTSRTHFTQVAQQCGSCHLDTLEDFTAGVHGRRRPSPRAPNLATCVSCHGAHAVGGVGDADSMVARARVATTCAPCHQDAFHQYRVSGHATAVAGGDPHAPTCVDCHRPHRTAAVDEPGSPVAPLRVAEETCARCHESVELTERHGLAGEVVSDFRGSFHGLALAAGDRRVANCASCHGAHEIRPASDPLSPVHPDNLDATCGKCHPGAAEGFARGGVHHRPSAGAGHRLVDGMRGMYLMLILVSVGGALAHNGLDFYRRLYDRRQARRRHAGAAAGAAERAEEAVLYLRFTLLERTQHWLLAASFITLALSGFALKLGWRPGWIEGERWEIGRAATHRAAALVFIALAAFHGGWLVVAPRGRAFARAILPRLRRPVDVLCAIGCCMRCGPPSSEDWRGMLQALRYDLGLSRERPRFDRFGYVEKMEYLGLVWGSLVMVATGLALWFEVPFLNRFPAWGLQLATVIHWFEAVLASLFIVVWHFYWTMVNPDVFPLSRVMTNGRLTREEMEREHPLELERIEGCACEPPVTPVGPAGESQASAGGGEPGAATESPARANGDGGEGAG
jgi:cytochrome b subunit of formate dehydrogenase